MVVHSTLLEDSLMGNNFPYEIVRACVRARVRACVRACVRVCILTGGCFWVCAIQHQDNLWENCIQDICSLSIDGQEVGSWGCVHLPHSVSLATLVPPTSSLTLCLPSSLVPSQLEDYDPQLGVLSGNASWCNHLQWVLCSTRSKGSRQCGFPVAD